MDENDSHLELPRDFFRSDLWREGREYSRAEAYLDMIASAELTPCSRIVEGVSLNLLRGELAASLRYLATRWNWSKSKVERYLELMKSTRRIRTRKSGTGQTVVIVSAIADSPEHPPPKWDTRGTRAGQVRDKLEATLTQRPTVNIKGGAAATVNGACWHREEEQLSDEQMHLRFDAVMDQSSTWSDAEQDVWRQLVAEMESGGKAGWRNFLQYLNFWRARVTNSDDLPLVYNGICAHRLLRDNPKQGPKQFPHVAIVGEMVRCGWVAPKKKKGQG